ncbi:MAG: hypothetical protein M1820_010590 [Bogoriella megaspora]|nr:MAG: hypothetical protein M1820_010590 [Bogoriella megaspora]
MSRSTVTPSPRQSSANPATNGPRNMAPQPSLFVTPTPAPRNSPVRQPGIKRERSASPIRRSVRPKGASNTELDPIVLDDDDDTAGSSYAFSTLSSSVTLQAVLEDTPQKFSSDTAGPGGYFSLVVGSEKQTRQEIKFIPEMLCEHSELLDKVWQDGKAYKPRRDALSTSKAILKNALPPRNSRQLSINVIETVCVKYPWAKTNEFFSRSIAKAVGVEGHDFAAHKLRGEPLLEIVQPALRKLNYPGRIVEALYDQITTILNDDGQDSSKKKSLVRAAALGKMYLEDIAPSSIVLLHDFLHYPNLDIRSAVELIDLYFVASRLQMAALQRSIINQLCSPLTDTKILATPHTIRSLAVKHPKGSLKIRRLIVDLLVYNQPKDIIDAMRAMTDTFFDEEVAQALLSRCFDGSSAPFMDAQPSCDRYHTHTAREGRTCY